MNPEIKALRDELNNARAAYGVLAQSNHELRRALQALIDVINSVPEDARIKAGLYSIRAMNVAQELLDK